MLQICSGLDTIAVFTLSLMLLTLRVSKLSTYIKKFLSLKDGSVNKMNET